MSGLSCLVRLFLSFFIFFGVYHKKIKLFGTYSRRRVFHTMTFQQQHHQQFSTSQSIHSMTDRKKNGYAMKSPPGQNGGRSHHLNSIGSSPFYSTYTYPPPSSFDEEHEEECKTEISEPHSNHLRRIFSGVHEVPSPTSDDDSTPPYMVASSLRHMMQAAPKEQHREQKKQSVATSSLQPDSTQTTVHTGIIETFDSTTGTTDRAQKDKDKNKISKNKNSDVTENLTEETDEEEALDKGDGDLKKEESISGPRMNNSHPRRHHHADHYLDLDGLFQNISRGEVFLIAFLVIFITTAVVAVSVSLAVTNNGSNSNSNSMNSDPHVHDNSPRDPPSHKLNPQEKFEQIRSVISRNPLTYHYALDIPDRLEYMERADHINVNKPPAMRAMSWILFGDDHDSEDDPLSRFSLAVLYYAMNGEGWSYSDGWLSNQEVCSSTEGAGNWFGITCRRSRNHDSMQIVELELSENNLTGEIAKSIVLIESLQSLWMDRNAITGHIDPDLFSAMHDLQFLYLQHNLLTGPIPNTFLKNGNNLRTYIRTARTCLQNWLLCSLSLTHTHTMTLLIFLTSVVRHILYSRQSPFGTVPS